MKVRSWTSSIASNEGAGTGPDDEIATLGTPEPGRVAIDLAVVDARPTDATATDSLLAVEARDGSSLSLSLARSLRPAAGLTR